MTRDGMDRFMRRVDRSGDCWLWLGGKTPDGYGRLDPPGSRAGGAPRRMVAAHRYFFEHLRGPVPDGMVLDHLCRVRACVNPEHLEAVTPRENTLRGVGATAVNAAKTHCAQGHPLAGANLYVERSGGRRCRECRNAYYRHRYATADSAPAIEVLAEDGES